MTANRSVLVGGTVIITVGYANAIVTGGNTTRVLVGGIGVALFASLVELLGPNASKLASGIIGLAVLTVILVEAPGIAQAYQNAQKNVGKSTSSTGLYTGTQPAASRPGVGQPGHSGLTPGP